MTIRHHPDEPMLVAFAAATLDLGQHVAIATHLVSCASCRGFAHAMEHVGGTVVINLPPAPMAANALAEVEARIAQPQNADDLDDAADEIGVAADVAGLPKFLRRYRFGDWRWIAPRVHLRRIDLPWPSATRVFLLKIRARHENASPFPYGNRDDLCSGGRIPAYRRPFRSG